MSKPTLYFTPMSPPVRAVMLLSKAMDLEFNVIPINILNQEHLSPEFLKMNPHHSLPTLDDDGVIIWDSHAIMTYLVDKYAADDELYPKDLVARAHVNQRLHFESAKLFESLRPMIFATFFMGATDIAEDKIPPVEAAYKLLEVLFDENEYLVGNKMTVADLSCISTISTLKELIPVDELSYPKLTAWIKRMEQLPYYEEFNLIGSNQLVEAFKYKLQTNKKESFKSLINRYHR